jgi:hypothetical protein
MTATRTTISRDLDKRFIWYLLSFILIRMTSLFHRAPQSTRGNRGKSIDKDRRRGKGIGIRDSGFRLQEKDKKRREVKKEIPRSSNLVPRAYEWWG